ncbi:hypothetical protein [Amycolatopsis orientalis]|nr:hypothetical protein [Amycolatopsis orientalis]
MTLKAAPSHTSLIRRVLAWFSAAGVMVRGHRMIGARPGRLDVWTR